MDINEIINRGLNEIASGFLSLTASWCQAGAMVSREKNFDSKLAQATQALEDEKTKMLEENNKLLVENKELAKLNEQLCEDQSTLTRELQESEEARNKAIDERHKWKENCKLNTQEYKIIDYARKMWNEEDFNFCVKVDVHVFVYDLPPKHDSGIDSDVDSEEYMDNMTINFVAASEKSIERLEKVLIKDDQIVCSICFENVHVGLEATKLPCTHTYHEKCIVQWLQTSKFCPMCRFEIV
ncbi:uncharacterized protein LOC133779935 [Humulus lupulus]|uniref:uncharacterized protein LOC133779935 n=1 Tax=Humulus lupulus TaxID=3486 RepID=UPI002B414E3A|nr:uncharacterized protein LOC133779935 [Humulus lupulus]